MCDECKDNPENEGLEEDEELVYLSDDDPDEYERLSRMHRAKYKQYEKKHKEFIARVLGGETNIESVLILPGYYKSLLSWALHTHIAEDGWKIIMKEGYHKAKPQYSDVETGFGEKQNLLVHGVLVLEKDENILVAALDQSGPGPGLLIVTGPERIKPVIEAFKDAVENITKERNFYRGQKIQYYGFIMFMDVSHKSWDDLILDSDTKDSIWANSIGFLQNRERLSEYNIPARRGVLMVGEPGTGKTLACKGILSAAEGITCITTRSDVLEHPGQLSLLYELAEDLAPSIVFLEDIDLIAQEREMSGYGRGTALLTLLSVLDGIEECSGVVTIATTNCKEKPALKQRTDLISLLCKSIPLDAKAQEYLAIRTENFTPAQIQEVIYSLAIDYCQSNDGPKPTCIICGKQDVDNAIIKIDRDNRQQTIGFSLPINGSLKKYGVNAPASNERS
ncbi:MAG: ATP-binding protein [Dehalococcoidia bacterium]|jgi:cell division protease FtsH